MRAYFGSTVAELKDFIADGQITLPELYAVTHQFSSAHSGDDEEELEFTLTLLAAEDALEFAASESSRAVVVAAEISEDTIDSSDQMIVTISKPIMWKSVEAVFTVGEDSEDLTWFAPQEVTQNIDTWN